MRKVEKKKEGGKLRRGRNRALRLKERIGMERTAQREGMHTALEDGRLGSKNPVFLPQTQCSSSEAFLKADRPLLKRSAPQGRRPLLKRSARRVKRSF
jgi:hypothetical protein